MRTLILFASKSGATRECAELLAARIANSTVFDLSKKEPDLHDADTVIIGSGIRMGRMYKAVRVFIERNLEKLLTMRTAVYFCNGEPDAFDRAVEKNIPAQLVTSSLCVLSFGGKPPFSSSKTKEWILMENVNELIDTVVEKYAASH